MSISPSENQTAGASACAVAPAESEHSERRFVRDILLINVPLPVIKFRSYLWLAMLSRYLGVTGYGTWALFQTTLDMATAIGSVTMGATMMRFLSGPQSKEERNVALFSVYAVNTAAWLLVGSGLILGSGPLSSSLFHDPAYRSLLFAVAGVLITDLIFEQTRGYLRARRLNQMWAAVTLGRIAPEMIAVVAAAALFKVAAGAIGAYVLCSVLAAVTGMICLTRREGFRLVAPSWRILRQYLSFGIALVPGSLAAMLSFSADKLLVGHYLDLAQVGIYSVCFTISALGFFMVGPVNDVLLPEMSVLHEQGDREAFHQRFEGVQKFVFGTAMCATAILFCFPEHLLRLVASDVFAAGAGSLRVLGLQGVFMSFAMLYAVLLKVRLLPWTQSAIWIGMGIMLLAMDVILLPRVGVVGAAISQLVSSIAGAAVTVALCWDTFRRTFRVRWALQSSAALGVLWLFAGLASRHALTGEHPIPVLLAGSAIYLGLLLAFGFTSLAELHSLVNAVVSRNK